MRLLPPHPCISIKAVQYSTATVETPPSSPPSQSPSAQSSPVHTLRADNTAARSPSSRNHTDPSTNSTLKSVASLSAPGFPSRYPLGCGILLLLIPALGRRLDCIRYRVGCLLRGVKGGWRSPRSRRGRRPACGCRCCCGVRGVEIEGGRRVGLSFWFSLYSSFFFIDGLLPPSEVLRL